MTEVHYGFSFYDWFVFFRTCAGPRVHFWGAGMTRCLHALPAVVLLSGLFVAPPPAQAQLNESPITPGFWSFPDHKVAGAANVIAVCRNHFEIRLADGHFIGLRTRRREVGLTQREVEGVGRCAFKRETQTDNCEMKSIHPDGSILSGTTENRYSLDGQKILKMHVTPRMITDSPVDNDPFDVFPVRCPDDAIWSILNEAAPPK